LKTGQIAYLNVLLVIGINGVLLTHVFMTTYGNWAPDLPKNDLYFCTVLRNLWHLRVPVLVMISGVLFLNPEREIPISWLDANKIFLTALFVSNYFNCICGVFRNFILRTKNQASYFFLEDKLESQFDSLLK